MSTKPTELPRWGTGGSAIVIEPSEGKKDLGWKAEERPPAAIMNWFQKNVYDWVVFLSTFKRHIPASAMQPRPTLPPDFQGFYWQSLNTADAYVDCPVIADDGRELDSVTLNVTEANLAGEEIIATFYEVNEVTGVPTAIGGVKQSGITGGKASFGWTNADAGFPLAMDADKSYFIEIELQQTSVNHESEMYGVKLEFV